MSAERVREHYRKQGEERERERIIELIDILATQEPDYAQVFMHNLKVLIRRENNGSR